MKPRGNSESTVLAGGTYDIVTVAASLLQTRIEVFVLSYVNTRIRSDYGHYPRSEAAVLAITENK